MSGPARDDLRGVFGRHYGRLLLTALLLLCTMLAGVGLLGLSGGFLTAAALAGVAGMGSGFNFFSPSAGIRALTFARIASRYGEKLVGHDATLRIARDLRVWFFRRALPLAPARLGASRTGELLARLMSDIGEVDGMVVRALGPLAALLGVGAVGVAAAAAIYWPAALVLALLALAIGAGVPWVVARGGRMREQRRAQRRETLRTLAYEGLEGAADLAALDAQAGWIARVDASAHDLRAQDRQQRQRLIGGNALHALCAALGLLAMLWLALGAARADRIGAEQAAGLLFLTVALLEVWAGAGLAWQALQSGRVAAQRLQAIAGQRPPVADSAQLQPVPAAGEVRFDAVGFAWPGETRCVLDGIDLRIAPGERIAISGDSGSGKTTLSALLLRLWDPQQGSIRFAGVDLRDLAQAQWHQRIAWLPQGAPVFAGSVRDNLRLGAADADDATLQRALADVRLDAWLLEVGGLDAWLGENGATMSAGQARRLALARALLRNAPLLVLDEPTEGLDVDTAQALLRDLTQALGQRSLLLISHDALPEGVVHTRYRMQQGRLQAEP
ncbi:thiol reductant ABC exporter subunit CydC [Xanthomonas sp. NCPPB 2654]|uniref:thiol reductant ABC exporter subunit CydC n=1 Tax=unclassified Xanthomonas TaxID=2643310 RepID=UPI0021DFA486|nr:MULTISPECIES: thiol reductant ABC exporter subunit CydC [unclassified Xanthomonas]MDL5366375.1 thiol reductant ABC exporter subunit CydC [Xanthomonas sp. NCPPB 2654]UYC22378.1 thiol reductant ABC exporter subunit CydC [Xanthomonas sp. CFBP 8443]